MNKYTTSAVEKIREDLSLLHQSCDDPHAAAASTCVQCLENLGRHIVNFFALLETSVGTVASNDCQALSCECVLFEVLSSPLSVAEFIRKSLSDELVTTATVASKAVQHAFAFLSSVVELGGLHVTPKQCVAMRRRATEAFVTLSRSNTQQIVQAEAVKLIVALLKLGPVRLSAADVDIPRLVDTSERALSKTASSQGVRAACLELLGKLSVVYPAEMLISAPRLVHLFMAAMKSMSEKPDPEHLVGEGLFKALDDFLTNFGEVSMSEGALAAQTAPAIDMVLLYHCIRSSLLLAEQTPRYQFPKAGLKLIKHHAHMFRGQMVDDATGLFEILRRLCGHKNVELHKAAYPASTAFLNAVAFSFCEDRNSPQSTAHKARALHDILLITKDCLTHRERPYELSFAISAYGALARPMHELIGDDNLCVLFNELSSKCEAMMNSDSDGMESAARHFPQFLTTYAALIIEMPEVTVQVNDAVLDILDAVLLLFPKQYYFPKVRLATPAAIMKLLIACSRHPILSQVLKLFVERGIVLSMGTSGMYREQHAAEGSDARQVEGSLYEEYAPLWCGLMTLKKDDTWGYPWTQFVSVDQVVFHQHSVRREILQAVCTALKTLDLQCTVVAQGSDGKPQLSGDAVPGPLAHHSALTAVEGSVGPRSPKDYALFLSLVQLFGKIAVPLFAPDAGDGFQVAPWMQLLLQTVSSLSAQLPHVSGLYTLTSHIVDRARHVISQSPAIAVLLQQFFDASQRRLGETTQELLFACASCLASFPTTLVSAERLLQPLLTLFRLGMEYEPAGGKALESLERLLQEDPSATQKTIVPLVFPYLRQYTQEVTLASADDDGDLDEGVARRDEQRKQLLSRVAALVGREGLRIAAAMRNAEDTLSANSMETEFNTRLHNIQLDSDRSLRLMIPLRDIIVELPVGKIIPRVLHLATRSTSRHSKVSASELLHSIVLWVVGSINLRPAESSGSNSDVLRVLFPACIALATSNDDVVRAMFHPLVLQLSHWYAQVGCETAEQLNRGPSALLDAVMESLCDSGSASAALRTVGSEVCSEYLKWAGKNVRTYGADSARLVFRRLAGLCHHPSGHERLGATVCFNRLYTVFRQMHETIVSEHSLDLLYHCFSALLLESEDSESGADVQLKEALVHLEKIIVFHSAMLSQPDDKRVGHLTTLSEAVNWLFQQCGSTQKLCRSLAMRLFTTLAACLPGFETEDGPSRWLHMTGQTTDIFEGVFNAFTIVTPERVVDAHITQHMFIEWGKELEASVACHLWLLAARYLSPHTAFGRRGIEQRKKQRVEAVLGGIKGSSLHTSATPSNCPKSQLICHIWAFITTIQNRKVASSSKEESQALWLTDDKADSDAPFMDRVDRTLQKSLSIRLVAVLESCATLLECLTERYPSSLWAQSDEEVGAGLVKPLFHMGLYSVAGELLMSPQNIFGQFASAALFHQRIRKVAQRLVRVCWTAIQTTCAAEKAPFIETLSGCVPASLRELDFMSMSSRLDKDATSTASAVEGLRSLQRIGVLTEVLARTARHTCEERLEHAATFLYCNRSILSLPQFRSFFSEYIGMLLESGVSTKAAIQVILEERHRLFASHGSIGWESRSGSQHPRGSSVDMQRASTGALEQLSMYRATSLWFSTLRSEVEDFLEQHADEAVAVIAETATSPDVVLRRASIELSKLLLCRVVSRRSAAVTSEFPLTAWQCYVPDADLGSSVFSDLLEFRLAALPHVVGQTNSACITGHLVSDIQLSLNPSWLFVAHHLLSSHAAVRLIKLGCRVLCALSCTVGQFSQGRQAQEAATRTAAELFGAFIDKLSTEEFPVSWVELTTASVEYEHYFELVEVLFRTAASLAVILPNVLLKLLPLLQDSRLPRHCAFLKCIQEGLGKLSEPDVAAVLEKAFALQQEPLPIGVRTALTYHFALPCLRRLSRDAVHKVFCDHVGLLVDQAEKIGFGSVTNAVSANTLCVSRTCVFVLLQTMYRICLPEALRGCINVAYVARGGMTAPVTSGKELTEKLMRVCVQARSFAPAVADEVSGLDARLLLEYRQSAYSCLVAVVTATQRQEKFFVQFLVKEKSKDLWHQIVDLKRVHEFAVETRFDELSEKIALVRSDWELTPGVDATDTKQRGAQRLRYLSSQFLHDTHLSIGHAAGGGDLMTTPPPASPQRPDERDDDVLAISATPRQHRDSVMASFQQEVESARKQQQEDDLSVRQPSVLLEEGYPWHADDAAVEERTGTVELDSIWRSSCCNTILQLIDALIHQFPAAATAAHTQVALTQHGSAAGGSWAMELVSLLASPDTHMNVKLVFARMITLRANFFDAFATELFEPLVTIAVQQGVGKGIHYVTRDVLLLLLRWRSPLPPHHPNSEGTANLLLSHLVRNLSHKTKRVVRANLEILKLLIEKWKGRVHIGKRDLMGWLAYEESTNGASAAAIARMCGVQICGVLAANNIPLYSSRFDAAVLSEEVFYKRLVANLSLSNKDVASATAEVLGLALRNLQAQSTTVDDRAALLRSITQQRLATVYQTAEPSRFLLLLRHIAESFAEIADDYVPAKLLGYFSSRLGAEDLAVVLEIFGMRCVRANQLYPSLHGMIGGVRTMRPLLKAAVYQLLLLLTPHLSPDLLDHLLSTFVTRAHLTETLSRVVDARVAFFKICIVVMDSRVSDVPSSTRERIHRLLVAGLDDPSMFVRDLLIRYWDQESRLSLEGASRFEQLFSKMLFAGLPASAAGAALAIGGSDDQLSRQDSQQGAIISGTWLQHAAILMMSLCHRNPDFQRADAMFPHPLKHCSFHPVRFDRRGEGRTSASVPSLFAPMFASQIPVSRLAQVPGSLGTTTLSSDRENVVDTPAPAGYVVATQQNRLFPQTQQGQFTVFERTVSPSQAPSALMFSTVSSRVTPFTAELAASQLPSSQRDGRAGVVSAAGLRRRFRHTEADEEVRQHIVHATRLRQQRDVWADVQRKERDSHVVIFRAYREGEVPDVQISLQSIVVPLQALMLADAELAQEIMTLIGASVMTRLREAGSPTPASAVPTIITRSAAQPSATFLVDVPAALSVQVAREVLSLLHQHVASILRMAFALPANTIAFCHELLYHANRQQRGQTRALAAMPAPEQLFSSCLQRSGTRAAGMLQTALLLLEDYIDDCSAATPSSSARAAPRERMAWAFYYLCLRSHLEEDTARAAARKLIDSRPDQYDSCVQRCLSGDWEAAFKSYAALAESLRSSAPNADPSEEHDATIITLRTLRFEAREALCHMLRWDDAVDFANSAADDYPLSCHAQDAWTVRAHEVRQLLRAHAISQSRRDTIRSPPQCLKTFPHDCFPLERSFFLLSSGEFTSAASTAREGLHQAMAGLGDDAGAFVQLHHLNLIADGCDLISMLRVDGIHGLQRLRRFLVDAVGNIPSDFTEDPMEWDTVLCLSELLSVSATKSFEALKKATAPDEVLDDLTAALRVASLRGGLSLAERPHSAAAAKTIMTRATSLLTHSTAVAESAVAAARYDAWAGVLKSTMWRLSFQCTSGERTVRQVWGEVQSNLRSKKDLVVKGVASASSFAELESQFWCLFALNIFAREGLTESNAAEIGAMSLKCFEKATTLTADSAEIAHHNLLHLLDGVLNGVRSTVVESAEAKIAALYTAVVLQCIEQYRSVAARELFPRLLQLMETHDEVKTQMQASSGSMVTLAVLPWCGQILTALTRPSGQHIALLAKRLVLHHPQVLYYPFSCIEEDLKKHAAQPATCAVVSELITSLVHAFHEEPSLSSVRDFANNIGFFHNPELRVRHWLTEMRRVFPSNDVSLSFEQRARRAQRMQELYAGMWHDCFIASPARGAVNRAFADAYAKQVAKEFCGSEASTTVDVSDIDDNRRWRERIDRASRVLRPLQELSSLQPLSQFSDVIAKMQLGRYGADFMEVPQQPFRYFRLAPAATPRVVGFDANLLVLSSQQRPKRLRMFTSDERAAVFLVKGGEDLRLDQRIEQLFFAINGMLRVNKRSAVAHLASAATSGGGVSAPARTSPFQLCVRTYSVVPITKRVGLVEWVADTAVLKDILDGQIRRDHGGHSCLSHPATKEYRAIFEQNATNYDRYLLNYKDAPNTNHQYSRKIAALLDLISPHYLRDGLQGLSTSAAGWYTMRGRFAASVSTVSIASYLLGIGDRHLENFLVDRVTGEIIPIDFGYSFGAATTMLPIPELVPFRLTPQMCNALGPLRSEALVLPMERTLAAVQRNKGLLMTLASAFLYEPLLDWEAASKAKGDGKEERTAPGAEIAETKLATLRRKLALENPTLLLEQDLEKNWRFRHFGVLAEAKRAARGDPQVRCAESVLTSPKEFVEVLIDMATDLNILGRTWAGWSPLF